jgi:hypothetical protein
MRCPVVRFGTCLANLTAQANPPTLTPTISAWAVVDLAQYVQYYAFPLWTRWLLLHGLVAGLPPVGMTPCM